MKSNKPSNHSGELEELQKIQISQDFISCRLQRVILDLDRLVLSLISVHEKLDHMDQWLRGDE